MEYFSDKERGPKPRIEEKISPTAWGGIVALISSLISTGAFGEKYPDLCLDGDGPFGTDEHAFSLALKAEITDIEWPLKTSQRMPGDISWGQEPYVPDTLTILDLIQFCYQSVSKPIKGSYHNFYRHHHLTFDEITGKEDFRNKINSIFSRNGIAYQLNPNGSIERLAPPIIRETLVNVIFQTGDPTLNQMLEDARTKFLNPDTVIRREAVERLWGCWERAKTLEKPGNKKVSISLILNKVTSDSDVRALLDDEARKLTDIGNSFHIRHTEVNQIKVTDSDIIDYLFHRLFCMIQLLLRKR